jgi:hypothetical protein
VICYGTLEQEEDAEEINLNATLTDLERASARMPAILSVLEDSLLELTQINDSDMRDRAYILLERLLLHCPRFVLNSFPTEDGCLSANTHQFINSTRVNFWHSVDGFLVDLHHSVPILDQGRNISAAQWMGAICKSLGSGLPI